MITTIDAVFEILLYVSKTIQKIQEYDDEKCNKLIEEAKVLKSSLDDRMNSH